MADDSPPPGVDPEIWARTKWQKIGTPTKEPVPEGVDPEIWRSTEWKQITGPQPPPPPPTTTPTTTRGVDITPYVASPDVLLEQIRDPTILTATTLHRSVDWSSVPRGEIGALLAGIAELAKEHGQSQYRGDSYFIGSLDYDEAYRAALARGKLWGAEQALDKLYAKHLGDPTDETYRRYELSPEKGYAPAHEGYVNAIDAVARRIQEEFSVLTGAWGGAWIRGPEHPIPDIGLPPEIKALGMTPEEVEEAKEYYKQLKKFREFESRVAYEKRMGIPPDPDYAKYLEGGMLPPDWKPYVYSATEIEAMGGVKPPWAIVKGSAIGEVPVFGEVATGFVRTLDPIGKWLAELFTGPFQTQPWDIKYKPTPAEKLGGLMAMYGISSAGGYAIGGALRSFGPALTSVPKAGAAAAKAGEKVGGFLATHSKAVYGVTYGALGGFEAWKVKGMYEAKMPWENILNQVAQDVALIAGFGRGFKTGIERGFPLRVEGVKVGEETAYKGLILQWGKETDKHIKFLFGKTPEGWTRGFPWLSRATMQKIYGPSLTSYVGYTPQTPAQTQIALKNLRRFWSGRMDVMAQENAAFLRRMTFGTKSAFIDELPFKAVFQDTHHLPAKYQKIFEDWLKRQKELIFGSVGQEAQLGITGLPARTPHDIDIMVRNLANESDRLYNAFMGAGGTGTIWREGAGLFSTKYGHFLDIKDIAETMKSYGSLFGGKYLGYGFPAESSVKLGGYNVMSLSEQATRKVVSAMALRWKGIGPAAHRMKDIVDSVRAELGLVQSQAAWGVGTAATASTNWNLVAQSWLTKVGASSEAGKGIRELIKFMQTGKSPTMPWVASTSYFARMPSISVSSIAAGSSGLASFISNVSKSIASSMASTSKSVASSMSYSPSKPPSPYKSTAPSPTYKPLASYGASASQSLSSLVSRLSSMAASMSSPSPYSPPSGSPPSYSPPYYSPPSSRPPYSSPPIWSPTPIWPGMGQRGTAHREYRYSKLKPYERRWWLGDVRDIRRITANIKKRMAVEAARLEKMGTSSYGGPQVARAVRGGNEAARRITRILDGKPAQARRARRRRR